MLTGKLALWGIFWADLLGLAFLALACRAWRRSGAQHREFEDFLTSIIENIPNMIFVKDAKNLRFVRFNKAGETLLGLSRESLIGKSDYDFFPKKQADFFTAKDREVLASGAIFDIPEEPLQTKDKGLRILHTKKIAIPDSNGKPKYLLGISEDITGKKKIEQMKKEIIAMTTHELKMPLSSIFGSLDVLATMLADQLSPEAKKLVDLAHRNSERMLRLVDDFLDIEKLEAGHANFHLEALPIAPLLRESIELNRPHGDRLGIQFRLSEDLPDAKVTADKDRLLQVLANFLSNAAKYSPSHAAVDVSASLQDGKVRVSVMDKGPGIPLDFSERIFEKFAQVGSQDIRQKGTGLGLAISKAIIEQFGGSVGFSSQPGTGSTFFFELPRT